MTKTLYLIPALLLLAACGSSGGGGNGLPGNGIPGNNQPGNDQPNIDLSAFDFASFNDALPTGIRNHENFSPIGAGSFGRDYQGRATASLVLEELSITCDAGRGDCPPNAAPRGLMALSTSIAPMNDIGDWDWEEFHPRDHDHIYMTRRDLEVVLGGGSMAQPLQFADFGYWRDVRTFLYINVPGGLVENFPMIFGSGAFVLPTTNTDHHRDLSEVTGNMTFTGRAIGMVEVQRGNFPAHHYALNNKDLIGTATLTLNGANDASLDVAFNGFYRLAFDVATGGVTISGNSTDARFSRFGPDHDFIGHPNFENGEWRVGDNAHFVEASGSEFRLFGPESGNITEAAGTFYVRERLYAPNNNTPYRWDVIGAFGASTGLSPALLNLIR